MNIANIWQNVYSLQIPMSLKSSNILRQKLRMYLQFTHMDNAINRLDWVLCMSTDFS